MNEIMNHIDYGMQRFSAAFSSSLNNSYPEQNQLIPHAELKEIKYVAHSSQGNHTGQLDF